MPAFDSVFFAAIHGSQKSSTKRLPACGSMYAPTLLAVVTFAAPQASASILRLKPRLPVSVPSGLRYLTSYLFPLFVWYWRIV